MRARKTAWTEFNNDAGVYEDKTGVVLGNTGPEDAQWIALPCGKCLGCRMAYAKSWALRCELEMQQHRSAVFTTLTYDEKHLPATLERNHLQLFFKRLRSSCARSATNRTLRFFACGEYGETNGRPHYHAIIFGLRVLQEGLIHDAWGIGHTMTVQANSATIAYTAGYTAKKQGCQDQRRIERVDPQTGEVYYWQPPFMQMSRRPGIGAHAKKWAASWRLYAIHGGNKMAPPRYLHDAWKAQATPLEQEETLEKKIQYALTRNTTPSDLGDIKTLTETKHALTRQRRTA